MSSVLSGNPSSSSGKSEIIILFEIKKLGKEVINNILVELFSILDFIV